MCTTRTQCTLRILEDVYNLFKRTLCIEEDVYSPYTVYILDDVYNRYAVYVLHDVYNPQKRALCILKNFLTIRTQCTQCTFWRMCTIRIQCTHFTL